SKRHPTARGGNAQSYDLTGCEFCTLSSLLEVGGESMLHARAVQHEHPRQRTRRLPASCAMLCHRALCIFLTTPLSYAAVAFYGGQYKKLLCYGKLPSNFPRLERGSGLRIARVCDVHELVTQHPRFPLQIRQHPIAILLFVRLLSCVNVCRTIAQHAVDQPSQLM